MKNYKNGMILGILSILCSLIFVGIPIGNNILEIINIIIYLTGLLLILFFSIVKKNDKIILITTIIYISLLTLFTILIELNNNYLFLIAIGFIPGLIISISGLIISKNNKQKYNPKISTIINSIGLLLSIISLLMAINNGFIIK